MAGQLNVFDCYLVTGSIGLPFSTAIFLHPLYLREFDEFDEFDDNLSKS